MTLNEIAIKHNCDKSSLHHDYCRIYESYIAQFEPYYTPEMIQHSLCLNLLEIGYGGYEDPNAGGESARMWREAYPNFKIVITDIHPKNNTDGVNFYQTDVTLMPNEFGDSNGRILFDIVIDDGSHVNADIIAAFNNLWPIVSKGGLYCVEDLHSSYDPFYSDSSPRPGERGTAMGFFSRLLHSVNSDFIEEQYKDEMFLYDDIDYIHFYKELVIIKKKS